MKYFVPEATAHAVRCHVQNLIPMDKYSRQAGGDYPISSLYLDSQNLQLCRESLDGRKNRFKLRIRSYTDEPGYPCFFEIKRRVNGICLKDRARVDRGHVAAILRQTGEPAFGEIDPDDRDALRQFMLYANSIHAGPMIKVRYMRQAYEDESHNRVRVTFDRRLSFKVVTTPDIGLNGPGWQFHTEPGVVLEIKFTGHYPDWVADTVRRFNLQRQSFSKYARSIGRSCLMGFCAPHLPMQRIVNR